MKRRLCQRTKSMGWPCRVMTARSAAAISMRIVLHQRRRTSERGHMATCLHQAIGRPMFSTGVFRAVLVSQFMHGCRAALTGTAIAGTEPLMLPPCPHLPPPRPGLDWRTLNAFGAGDRGDRFYDACLEYAHSRSEEHTSELQSHSDLVCRLLL